MSARDDVYAVLGLLSELEQLLWPARRREDPGGYGTDLGVPPPLPPTGVWTGGDDRRPVTATYDEWVGRGVGDRASRGPAGEIAPRNQAAVPTESAARPTRKPTGADRWSSSERSERSVETTPPTAGPASPPAPDSDRAHVRQEAPSRRVPPPAVRSRPERNQETPAPAPRGPKPRADLPITRPDLPAAAAPERTTPPVPRQPDRDSEPRTRSAFARVELTPPRERVGDGTRPAPPARAPRRRLRSPAPKVEHSAGRTAPPSADDRVTRPRAGSPPSRPSRRPRRGPHRAPVAPEPGPQDPIVAAAPGRPAPPPTTRPPTPARAPSDDVGPGWLPASLPAAGVRVGRAAVTLTPRQAARARRWVRATHYDRVVRRLS